uniref:Uncharacterized protein n=1 Tax=Pediococcus pentosaceus TaxID=1255 RepID=Q9X3B3_PEDPE|nr:unknown [Pediococcus pentosaceus]
MIKFNCYDIIITIPFYIRDWHNTFHFITLIFNFSNLKISLFLHFFNSLLKPCMFIFTSNIKKRKQFLLR